jgi:uncharacterized protein DUF4440
MPGQDFPIEEEIIRLSTEWIEAVGRRDGNAIDRILAGDFLIAGWLPGGKLGSRQFYIDDALRPVDMEQVTFSHEQWKFRIYEGFVITNCVFKCHGLIAGKEWGGEFLFTDVWIKQGDGWRVVTRHTSQVLSR